MQINGTTNINHQGAVVLTTHFIILNAVMGRGNATICIKEAAFTSKGALPFIVLAL